MRSIDVMLGGRQLTLKATFDAAAEIAKKVADPLAMAREAALEATLGAAGQVYHPRFAFTVENLPVIILAGAKAAGEGITLKEVQEAVFEEGLLRSKEIAAEFIAMLVMPNSQEAKPTARDSEPGE
jgi:hypothetical protein